MRWVLILAFVIGCGEPGNRPYCGVCDLATGFCSYTPEERQANAEKKASVWYTDPITISPIGEP